MKDQFIAFDPDGQPVHDFNELPKIRVPSMVRVTDGALLVDGWRFQLLPLRPFSKSLFVKKWILFCTFKRSFGS